MMKVCSKCSQPNPPEAAFCHNCASPLAVGGAQDRPWPQDPGATPIIGGHAAAVAAPAASQKPMIAMILAIAAFFCCGPLLGIPAAILGWMELDAIKNGRSPEGGRTMATVGLWGGVIATAFHTIFYLIWFLLGLVSSAPY